jgi:flagellar protein FlaF
MSIAGYEQVGNAVISGRALEARVLTRCAMALNLAMENEDQINLVDAVTMNYRLWLFFYSEIESGRVTLPQDVANNIVSLVGYVVKASPNACAGDRAAIETLININRNIAAGLLEGTDVPMEAIMQPGSEAQASVSATA